MNNDKWIWVIRKSNQEPIRILDIDFDADLYELKEKSEVSAVKKAVGKKEAEQEAVDANAEQLEKNAAAKRQKGSAK